MKIAIIGASGHWTYALNELKNHSIAGICAGFQGENMENVEKTLSENGIEYIPFNSFEEIAKYYKC